MESDSIIWLFLGGLFLLCAIGLSLVRIDRGKLKASFHTNPGMALFRFGAFRWGAVVVFGTIGLVLLSIGLGWLN